MESVKAFKRKMLLWTSNWSQEDFQSSEEVRFTPDAVEIASLLKATGFRIRFMDQCSPKEMHPVPGVPADSPACRVILMCPRSGIRMELDAPTSACKCPLPDKSRADNSGDQSTNKRTESLVPSETAEISKTVSELIGGLFTVMSSFPDMNHNDIKIPYYGRAMTSPMKTPATGITVVTPNAPCVPKANLNGDSKNSIPGRYRSLDTLISSAELTDGLPEPGQLTPKDDAAPGPQETRMEVDGELDTTYTQGSGSAAKKFISKSSPAINCTETFEESSTFAFGDDDDDDDNDAKDENSTVKKRSKPQLLRTNTYSLTNLAGDKAEEEEAGADHLPRSKRSPFNVPPISQSMVLLGKLQQVQLYVSDMIHIVADNEKYVSNIGDVCKTSKAVNEVVQLRMADRVRPIRCLSDFGSVPNLSRAGGPAARSIPRPKIRRYTTMTTAPATPTTSRRRGAAAADRQKKNGSANLKIGSNRVAPNCGTSLQKISASPSATSSTKNNEPIFNAILNKKSTVNFDARYANLQSSCIPKPANVRK